jgi:flagellar biosynthetic protein FliQ
MTAENAIDLTRDVIRLSLLLGGPLLAAALVAGLLSGMLQTATQIHEHTLSFVPKLAAVVLAVVVALPWLLARLVDYADQLIRTIPQRL